MKLKKCVLLRVILSLVFAGFVFPLWAAHNLSIEAIYEVTRGTEILNSYTYSMQSRDLAFLGYVWCGCSMIWLFWYVTRKK